MTNSVSSPSLPTGPSGFSAPSPEGIAKEIKAAREAGHLLVCGYLSPGGFWQFDGRDAFEIVRPALGATAQRNDDAKHYNIRMDDPFGSVGMQDIEENHQRLRAAGISIALVASIKALKECQTLVDRGLDDREPPPSPELSVTADDAADVSGLVQRATRALAADRDITAGQL